MAEIDNILSDKLLKSKAKVLAIGRSILDKKISNQELIAAAKSADKVNKANIVEGIQWAAEKDPSFADKPLFVFLCKMAGDKTDRVKWEASRALSHMIPLFPTQSEKALTALLENTEQKGMVVRWSAAKALVAIYEHHQRSREDLQPVFEAILKRETDASIRKIYQKAVFSR